MANVVNRSFRSVAAAPRLPLNPCTKRARASVALAARHCNRSHDAVACIGRIASPMPHFIAIRILIIAMLGILLDMEAGS